LARLKIDSTPIEGLDLLSNFGYWTFQPFLVEFISNTIKDIRRRTIESSQHNPLNSGKKHVKIG
jgi:hypothetical protein